MQFRAALETEPSLSTGFLYTILYLYSMNRVISSGPLQRPDWFQRGFAADVQGKRFARFLGELSKSYYNKKAGISGPLELLEEVQPGVNGLAVICNEFETDFFRIFIDHVKELIRAEGYYLYTSDARLIDRDGVEILAERHYLKPSVPLQDEGPTPQVFGNITLEYIMRHGRADHLKIVRTYYSDRNFAEPRSFDELIDLISEIGL